MADTTTDYITKKIQEEIEQFAPTEVEEEVGRVVAAGDGIAEIDGLAKAAMAEVVIFDAADQQTLTDATQQSQQQTYGLILNLEEELVKAIVLGEGAHIAEGMTVRRTGKLLSVPAGDEMLGRVVNPLGDAIDGRGSISATEYMPVERTAPGVMDRASVDTPLATGTMAIDAMVPIGRGQRELVIGDRQSGKTTLAIDAIINQQYEPKDRRPICIYVAVGQKESKTARLIAELQRQGAMEYTIVVDAPASAPAALQFLAPFAGSAFGEHFMHQGRDVYIVFDDLSKQATAYRQLSLLLRRPPGREAYPGDIFYLHSRLLERSAKLDSEHGGGSMTALPIIETQEGDVSAYIPTNVISITDGQIYLDTDLFNKGMRPAISVGISVSRVGSSAQTKAMKKVAGKVRLELAQFRELEAFMQFAQDLDPATKARIDRGQRISALLNQYKHEPMPTYRQVPLMYAAVNEYLSGVPVERVGEFKEQLLAFLDARYPKLFEQIAEKGELTDEIESTMREALTAFKTAHRDLYAEETANDEEQKDTSHEQQTAA